MRGGDSLAILPLSISSRLLKDGIVWLPDSSRELVQPARARNIPALALVRGVYRDRNRGEVQSRHAIPYARSPKRGPEMISQSQKKYRTPDR